MRKQIVIDVDPEGNCSIDGIGFVGVECSHFIDEIQKSLGKQTSIKNKPEYKQRRKTRDRNRQLEGGR